MPSNAPSISKGFLAGAVGGAIGTGVLTAFQLGSLKGTRIAEERLSDNQTYTEQQRQLLDSFEKAHAKTAEVAAGAAGVSLSPGQRKKSVPAVEFAFGILCGGIYGALAEHIPSVTAGMGATYGAVLFTGASEVVLPALRWVPSPADRTPVQHLGGLSGNVVYGLCTEAVRRLLRRAL